MSRCFVVLGMHRSATSLIAKGLHMAGVFMGKNFLQADSGNPQGYFEDSDFVNVNKWLLTKAGGDWYNVPKEEAIRKLGEDRWVRREISTLVRSRSASHKLWGWKDPRTVLTIKLFLPYLPEHFFFVAFRKPEDCAGSMARRDGTVGQNNLVVVHEYNRRLMDFLREQNLKWL